MIVEPVPTNPRSPARRGLRLAALAAPLVLLVAVVAAGALGPRPDPEARDVSTAEVSQPADAPATPLLVAGREVDFPSSWIGLRVRTSAEALEARGSGGAGGIIALSGFLSYGSLDWRCADAWLEADRSGCEGRTLLADRPVVPGAAGAGFADVGPHLHPQLPPGTRAPAPDDTPGSPRAEPIPVVVLGAFDSPRAIPCTPAGRDCADAFVVERVVWVAGAPWGPLLTVDPAMHVDPNIPEIQATVKAGIEALGRGALPLATVVVRPAALAVIDPAAAAAIASDAERLRSRPVTYVRGLVFEFDASQPLYGRDPELGWVVLDAIAGTVLARSGPASAPVTGTTTAPGA